tara:strand:- start:2702 stop:3187 length:486 start_codon:yes stop_codon:yes gene_type:complete
MSENKEVAVPVGNIPSGLFIVCAHDKDSDITDGFLASWVQQVSFDPLLVTLAVKPGRPCSDQILEKSTFSINIVGDHDTSYLKHFWSGYDENKNPFGELDHELTADNGVVLKAAKATLICRPKEISQPGDHNLVVAEVIASFTHEEKSKSKVHLRKTGLDY